MAQADAENRKLCADGQPFKRPSGAEKRLVCRAARLVALENAHRFALVRVRLPASAASAAAPAVAHERDDVAQGVAEEDADFVREARRFRQALPQERQCAIGDVSP